jgi:hypothetical protein
VRGAGPGLFVPRPPSLAPAVQGPSSSSSSGPSADRGLYLSGLKAMLSEMRMRRPPDTPFGHTQQLQAQFSAGAKVAKVRRAGGRPRAAGGVRLPVYRWCVLWERWDG